MQPERRHNVLKELKRSKLATASAIGLPLFAIFSGACGSQSEHTPDDGYTHRAVHHAVVNPLNGDKYTTFEFRDRGTQAKSEVNFHHLKSNPEKFERLITDIGSGEAIVLDMQQENVPLDDIEFQHSTIILQNPATGEKNTLQINRVKPVNSDAAPVTAYSIFAGAENPKYLNTIIISDKEDKDGNKGEMFVSLNDEAIFGFDSTTERFANQFINQADQVLSYLKSVNFSDPRVSQATWKVEDKDKVRTTRGIIGGENYTIISKRGGEKAPGYREYGKNFKEAVIQNGRGLEIARVTKEHFDGPGDGDAVIFKFYTDGDCILELKRVFKDKSETQTSTGTARSTTIGVTTGGSLFVGSGWSDVEMETPVNFQDENTFLYSFGSRDGDLTEAQKDENLKKVSAILVLLGGESILNGLNFQDSEMEWRQSSDRLIEAAHDNDLKPDMGAWLELPIDSTETGIAEAKKLIAR